MKRILTLALCFSSWAMTGFSQARVTKIAIQNGPYRVETGKCSPPLRIAPVNSTGAAVQPKRNIKVFTDQSDPLISFFADPDCKLPGSSFLLGPARPTTEIFFRSTTAGQRKLAVSSSQYEDDSQVETFYSGAPAPSPGPSPVPSPSPVPTPVPSPSPGVPASGQVVGITLDDVSDSVRSAEIAAIQALGVPLRTRVVFDGGMGASYYLKPVTELKRVTSIMGQIADSTDMKNYTPATYQARAESYLQGLNGLVDVWEIGNEVNGNWLGTGTFDKLKAAYSAVKVRNQKAALTFFYMGEPADAGNCIDAPGNDQFSWIQSKFQLGLPAASRDPATESMRLGLDEVLVSWYPDGCSDLKPDWTRVFTKLAGIFPNSKVGFGEIGTQNPQYGSPYEKALIQEFYPLRSRIPLPASYTGGYYWWYFAEEMVPHQNSPLFQTLFQAIR
jgi:hypothetical protein